MKYIFGNWKMSIDLTELRAFVAKFSQANRPNKAQFGIAAPYVFLNELKNSMIDMNCFVGAENVSEMDKGAFTGEISAKMLSDLNMDFCLVGHSERRHIYGETDSVINEKISKLLQNKVFPVLCIGETLQDFEAKKTKNVLKQQLKDCLKNFVLDDLSNLIIAYEPVWAIGSGKTATTKEITDCITYIKNVLKDLFGENNIPVLYGGSVKPSNANDILNLDCVDGALIGGASLDANAFVEIANAIK